MTASVRNTVTSNPWQLVYCLYPKEFVIWTFKQVLVRSLCKVIKAQSRRSRKSRTEGSLKDIFYKLLRNYLINTCDEPFFKIQKKGPRLSRKEIGKKMTTVNLKGKRANLKTSVTRKQSTPNFPESEHFLALWYAHPGGKKYLFFGKFGVFCFPVTPVLELVILLYYRPIGRLELSDFNGQSIGGKMEIRLKNLYWIISKLTGGKNENPRWEVLKWKTSIILIVCSKEIIPWRAK